VKVSFFYAKNNKELIILIKIMKQKQPTKITDLLISNKEKTKLRDKILSSVYLYKRKKQVQYFAVAASITMLFSVVIFKSNQGSINQFIEIAKEKGTKKTNIELILTDKKKIDIKEKNSVISYSKTGKKLTVGTSTFLQEKEPKASKSIKTVYNTLIVPYGKRSKLTLSDGSIVWLNSGSKLIFPITFNHQVSKREVYLEGEAIFEVTHNKKQPFMVLCKNHQITVLGTVFNISNYLDEKNIKTTLKSGRVEIRYRKNIFMQKTIKIIPNTMAIYEKNSNTIQTKKVEVAPQFSWREGILIFKNDNLKFIMKKLSRYYNVAIEITNTDLANQTFSGYLDLKDSLEKVLQIIKVTSNFTYTHRQKIIIITKTLKI